MVLLTKSPLGKHRRFIPTYFTKILVNTSSIACSFVSSAEKIALVLYGTWFVNSPFTSTITRVLEAEQLDELRFISLEWSM